METSGNETAASYAKGIFYGIGVGPGDPELITVKALKTMERCDVFAFPQSMDGAKTTAFDIAKAAAPEITRKELLPLSLPMSRDPQLLETYQQKAAEEIIARLVTGKNVAFLTLGDSSIYSTFGYLRRLVQDAGCASETIPGIPSFCAAAAVLGEDLVIGSGALHIIPVSGPQVDDVLNLSGTRVLMKAGKDAREIMKKVETRKPGKNPLTICGVANCGLENERVWKNLDELNKAPPDTDYFTLFLIKDETPPDSGAA